MDIKKILVVEDDVVFVHILKRYLERYHYDIITASTLLEAKHVLAKDYETFGLILLDYNLPDGKGSELVDFIRGYNHELPILIMTSFNDVKTAVEMMKRGVREYITKPINQEELLMHIKELLEPKKSIDTNDPNENFKIDITNDALPYVKGQSLKATNLYKQISLVAETDMSVLIQGESGTGKENIARTLHVQSKRKDAPFIAIDCGALNNDLAGSELFGHVKGSFSGAVSDKKGQFELAHGGTIFLDEVGNLSYENQVKLLRVLQEKEILRVGDTHPQKVDIRLITATNENLTIAIKNGSFREDLYFRINEFSIQVPCLKDRLEDLDDFIAYFIQKSNQELQKNITGVNGAVKNIFLNYNWPGNIRELQNIIKRGVLLATQNEITLAELPVDMQLSVDINKENNLGIQNAQGIKKLNEQMEKELIIKTLIATQYNKSKAAKILKIDRSTLYSKLVKYNIILD